MPVEYLDRLIAYEEGRLTPNDVINLFQELVDSGHVWRLQGHYGWVARRLIELGMIHERGHKMSELPCSEVCELVINRLSDMGFDLGYIGDDHQPIFDALGQVVFCFPYRMPEDSTPPTQAATPEEYPPCVRCGHACGDHDNTSTDTWGCSLCRCDSYTKGEKQVKSHNHRDYNVGAGLYCPNCDDGCIAAKDCLGCDHLVCDGCWEEHNNDAPCHIPD